MIQPPSLPPVVALPALVASRMVRGAMVPLNPLSTACVALSCPDHLTVHLQLSGAFIGEVDLVELQVDVQHTVGSSAEIVRLLKVRLAVLGQIGVVGRAKTKHGAEASAREQTVRRVALGVAAPALCFGPDVLRVLRVAVRPSAVPIAGYIETVECCRRCLLARLREGGEARG